MQVLPSGLLVCVSAILAAMPQDPVRQTAALQRAAELARPAEPHLRLQRLLGRWQVSVTTMGDEPRVEPGTVEGTSWLGGRYVMLHHRLQTAGGGLEAIQLLGFHTLHQLYTSSWRDDHSTWSVECTGPADPAAPDRLVLQGSLVDARDPEGRPFRLELDLADERVDVRLFDTVGGAVVLQQTQQWTRVR